MTPKEKAKELFTSYLILFPEFYNDLEYGYNDVKAKQCALISVDEIIEGIERAFDEYEKGTGIYVKNRIFYWDFYSDVKQEINKL